jgi:hypothetical protein
MKICFLAAGWDRHGALHCIVPEVNAHRRCLLAKMRLSVILESRIAGRMYTLEV